jgi:hypothetical protein
MINFFATNVMETTELDRSQKAPNDYQAPF